MSESVLPICSYKSFIVSGLTFRPLIHFEFIFVQDIRKCSSFILLHVVDQLSQHHLLKIVFNPFYIFPFIFPFLSLCWYHTVLKQTMALQQSLKSGRLIPPVPFFFLKIALAIQGFLYFHKNLEIICSSSVRNVAGSLIGIALNL